MQSPAACFPSMQLLLPRFLLAFCSWLSLIRFFTIVLYSIGWVYHDVLIYSAVEHLVWFQVFLLASCTAGNILVHMYFSWEWIEK